MNAGIKHKMEWRMKMKTYNDNKLVQIMKTPKPMVAIYERENGSYHEENIFCMGLNELGDVVFLTLDNTGVASDVMDGENFIAVMEGVADETAKAM